MPTACGVVSDHGRGDPAPPSDLRKHRHGLAAMGLSGGGGADAGEFAASCRGLGGERCRAEHARVLAGELVELCGGERADVFGAAAWVYCLDDAAAVGGLPEPDCGCVHGSIFPAAG